MASFLLGGWVMCLTKHPLCAHYGPQSGAFNVNAYVGERDAHMPAEDDFEGQKEKENKSIGLIGARCALEILTQSPWFLGFSFVCNVTFVASLVWVFHDLPLPPHFTFQQVFSSYSSR